MANGACTCARDGHAWACPHHTQEDFEAASAASLEEIFNHIEDEPLAVGWFCTECLYFEDDEPGDEICQGCGCSSTSHVAAKVVERLEK